MSVPTTNDWITRAKGVLRYVGIQDDAQTTRVVLEVAAALAKAYEEGRDEPCTRCKLVREMGPLADH